MVATKATAMPRPTSSMLSRCCMTWISPSTAPMMPMVGEKPPADSKTWGMCSSCSAWLSSSSSIILRSSCGSVPSTASMSDFFRKGLRFLQFRIERNDAFPPGLMGIMTNSCTICRGSSVGFEKDMTQAAEGGEHHRQRKLDHHRAQGAAEDDHGGGGLHDLGQPSAFQQQAPDNSAQPQ